MNGKITNLTNGSDSKSTGQATTNGAVNMANGTTNGAVNMANGNTNGTVNMANGNTNGAVNGTVKMANGTTNGMANGAIKKTTNGTTNGVVHGASNGAATNGTSNGAADDSAKPSFRVQIMQLVEELELPDNCKLPAAEGEQLPPMIRFRQPSELMKLLPELGKPAEDDEALLELCRQLAQLCTRTGDFRFRNQLFGGADPYGMAAALLGESLNASVYTYEVSPVFSLCEDQVLRKVRGIIGWKEGDGIFSAGGSMSNQYALALARYRRYPDLKKTGMFGRKPLVVFTSADCHYSVAKAAHWHGYGSDNVISVETDESGSMKPEALEAAILRVQEEGREPVMVNATCGTTVLGAYDPVEAIADICERHGIYLHVDACWGGAALFTPTWRHLMAGCERADSLAWNPHKMLGAPQQCALFVTRHADSMKPCNSASASYLFQKDKFYDVSYDTGDKSIQCGRKTDAFKVWLMWQAHGDAGIAALIDNTFAATRYCDAEVARRPGFRPVLSAPAKCTNCSFWYIPKSLRGEEETADWWAKVAKVGPKVKEAMMRQGTMMVGYQPMPHKGLVNFFRLVFTASPPPGKPEVDYILNEIERLGIDL